MTDHNTGELSDVIAHHQSAWPWLEPHIPGALVELRQLIAIPLLNDPQFVEMLRARYEQGEREYQREWVTWPDSQRFYDELREELADAIMYLAMRRAAFPGPGDS